MESGRSLPALCSAPHLARGSNLDCTGGSPFSTRITSKCGIEVRTGRHPALIAVSIPGAGSR